MAEDQTPKRRKRGGAVADSAAARPADAATTAQGHEPFHPHAHAPAQEPEPWWIRGLLSGLGGYVFSLILSAVLVALAVARFEPVMALERTGIDMAMKVYVAFPTLLGNVPRTPSQSYAFIDIDEGACRAFTPASPDDCGATKAIAPAAAAALVDALRGSGAKVVVLDIVTPQDATDRRILTNALTGPSTPWLIAAIDSGPGAHGGEIRSDPSADLVPGRVKARAWLAAMTTFSDPTAPDGLVRHYPPSVRVRGPKGETSWLPTAPFLAAALAAKSRNGEGARCLFYGGTGRPCPASPTIAIGERRFSMTAGGETIRLDRAGVLDRISYSLPSLDADSDEGVADQFRGLYDRYVMSNFDLSGGVVHLPPSLLDGRIVVIGTTQPAGHDWHSTPLGSMPGSEIMLNAARGFAEFAPSQQSDPNLPLAERISAGWQDFLEKLWPTTWMAVITFMPAWIVIAFVSDRTHHHRHVHMRLGGTVICVSVFMAALFACLGLEVFGHSSVLRAELREGRTVDLISPIFGLGMEGYADASKAVANQIEAGLAILLAQGLAFWPRARMLFGKKR